MTPTPVVWVVDGRYIGAKLFLSESYIFLNLHLIDIRHYFKEAPSMKLTVRALIAILVLTGAAATTQTSSASTRNKVTAARASMLPVPVCAPDDPNACGMGRGR
jgi:hypothetical protein